MNTPDAAPVIDLIEAFRRSKAMFAAVALGLFDQLANTPTNAATLAQQMGSHPDATERLLDACVGLGFLRKEGGLYANLPVADAYLCRSSPTTLAGYILYSNRALYRMWGHLEGAIREGSNRWHQTFGPEDSLFGNFFRTEEGKREFLMGMNGFGRLSSPKVVAAFDLGQFHQLVDLGGATGHLAIAACERYPSLRATLFDLPPVIEVAREYVERSEFRDRISFLAGDFFLDALPRADLVAVGRILHDWSEEKIKSLLRKICAALPSRGALLIAERLLDEDKTGPLSALMQSLNMLVCTEGKERTLSEYTLLLREAGFSDVEGRKTGAPLDAVLAVK